MKTFGRITLLALFAAAGVALAVGTGFSTVSPSVGDALDSSDTAPRDVGMRQPPEPATEDASRNMPHGATLDQPSPERAEGDSPLVIPQESVPPPDSLLPSPQPTTALLSVVPNGPLEVEPHPLRAQQAVPEADPTAAQRVFDLTRQLLAQPPAGSTDDVAMQPPAADANAGQPPAADGLPAAAPPATAPPQDVTTTVNGEGDGRLSIHIPDEPIRDVLDLLSQQGNLNVLASNSVQGNVSATLSNVDLNSALGAILKSTGYVARREGDFIFVGTPEEFQLMDQSMDRVGTRVYRPNYVTAAELQSLITPLLTEKVGVVTVSSPAETGMASDDSSAGGDAFAGAEVVLVRDYEAVLAQIDQLVDQIDVRPLQVAIEAMILSVKLDDETSLGVNFDLLRNNPNIRFTIGKPPSALPLVPGGGLEFAFLDSSLGAFVEALEEIKDTNVIATPRLMVLNKHRADIQIGRQEGYVSTTQTETSTTQSVEFLDTGTLLRLRPFISSDGLIRMEVHPELSSGEVKLKGNFTVPEKEVTQVTTNIMVRNGCTVVIGGLIREELVSTPSQVPFFGNLPLVGVAFRHTTEEVKRDEILVLITPRIVYEPEACREGHQVACEFHRRQNLYDDKMLCIGKRSVGRRYFRLAQDAWAVGDRDAALRFAEMAVHFDPLNRAAIDLRSDIWQGRRQGEHTLGRGIPHETSADVIDAVEGAPWPAEDAQEERSAPTAPLHPWDPGQPGPRTNIVRPGR